MLRLLQVRCDREHSDAERARVVFERLLACALDRAFGMQEPERAECLRGFELEKVRPASYLEAYFFSAPAVQAFPATRKNGKQGANFPKRVAKFRITHKLEPYP